MKNTLFLSVTIVLAAMFLSPCALLAQKTKKDSKPAGKTKGASENDNKAQFLFIKGEGHFVLKEYSKAIPLYLEALDLSPDNAAIHYKLSESYVYSGVLSKAIEHGKKAIELDKTKKQYYVLLADVYLSNMEFEQSISVYEQLLANVKGTNEFYFELAELYNELVNGEKSKKDIYRQNNISNSSREKEINKNIENYALKAINAYNEAEKHYGAHEEITFKKQRLYLALNKVDEAISEGEKLIKAFPGELRYKLNQAELIYNNNRQKEAIAYLQKEAEMLPNEPTPLLMLSEFYKGIGDQKNADIYLEKAFNNPALDVDAKVQMVASFLQYANDDQKKQTALILSKRIVETHPDKPQAHSVYADVLFINHQKMEARDAYHKAALLDPTKFLIWQQLVGLDADLNQHDSLISHSSQAIVHFPDNPTLWLYNGLGYQLTKQKYEAVASYEKGRDLSKGNAQLESQFNAQLGDAYNDIQQFQKSDDAYDKALEFDPNNVHVLNNYSYFLSLRKEKLQEAKAMSERVVRMNPEEATYLDTYAWVLYMLKDYDGAKKYLEKALKSSNDGTIVEHYGDTLFQLGKTQEALEQWKKAKEQGGTSDLIDKKIKDKKLYE